MAHIWEEGRGLKLVPLAIVALGSAIVMSAAGYASYTYRRTLSANPMYAPSFVPFCSPCFGRESVAVSTFRPAYLSHVPTCYSCGLPCYPVNGTPQQAPSGDRVNVINNVTIVQTVQVLEPDGYGADPWNSCRCGPATRPSAADLGISQSAKVDIAVNVKQ